MTSENTNNKEEKLSKKVPLPDWLALVEGQENRVTMLRETTTILRQLASKLDTRVAAATVEICTLDGVPFNAACQVPTSPPPVQLTSEQIFAELFYFTMTRRTAKFAEVSDWMKIRLSSGLSVEATLLLDSLLHFDASLDTLDLCPAALYSKPAPPKSAVRGKANQGKKIGLLLFGLASLTILLIAVMADTQPTINGEGVQRWYQKAEERNAILYRQKQRIEQFKDVIALLKKDLAMSAVQARNLNVLSSKTETLTNTLFQRDVQIRSLEQDVDTLQAELRRMGAREREMERNTEALQNRLQEVEHLGQQPKKRVRRKLEQCLGKIQEQEEQLAQAHAVINTVNSQRQEERAKYRAELESRDRATEELEAEIAALRIQADVADVIRAMKESSGVAWQTLQKMGGEWRQKMGEVDLRKLWRELTGKGGKSQEEHKAEMDKLRSKMGVLQGDYDACMNELFRVRTENNSQ